MITKAYLAILNAYRTQRIIIDGSYDRTYPLAGEQLYLIIVEVRLPGEYR
jgi:hypothetical protein